MIWLDVEQQLVCEHKASLDKLKEDNHKFETNKMSRVFRFEIINIQQISTVSLHRGLHFC